MATKKPGLDMAKVTQAYLNIRDERAKIRKEWQDEDKKLLEAQDKIEAVMLKNLSESGVESARTEHGTFYRQKDTIPQGSDWDAFYSWVAENDAFEALERRIKKTFINEYMEENDGATPPGVSVHSRYVIRVRKAN